MAEPVVVRLADIRASDTEVAGGKGATLGELIAAGFPVPDGFVLGTAAYRAAARAAQGGPPDARAAGEGVAAPRGPRRGRRRAWGGGAAGCGSPMRPSRRPPPSVRVPSRSARQPPLRTCQARASRDSRTRTSAEKKKTPNNTTHNQASSRPPD